MKVQYEKIIESCIDEIVEEYHSMVRDTAVKLVYIMESDIQACLYSKILCRIRKASAELFFKAEISKELQKRLEDKDIYSTVLHCEVPAGKRKHIDIGIWDEFSMNEGKNESESYKSKKIKYAIEIKYNWQSRLTAGLKGEMQKDIEKMRDTKVEVGYLLCFLARNFNKVTEVAAWQEFLKEKGLRQLFEGRKRRLYLISPQTCCIFRGGEWS